jgi:hypothetical protein
VFLRLLGAVNMIRGFFIFLVFIWKPSIWKAVKDSHPRVGRLVARLCCCFGNCCCGGLAREDSQSLELRDNRTGNGNAAAGQLTAAVTGSSSSPEELAALRLQRRLRRKQQQQQRDFSPASPHMASFDIEDKYTEEEEERAPSSVPGRQ